MSVEPRQRPLQEDVPPHHCWGCGSLNQQGLRIQSFWDGDESVCTWRPGPEHAAGPPHVLNGGIIATLIDCHSVCTAISKAVRTDNDQPDIWLATGSLQVTYLRPTPLDTEVTLRARVTQQSARKSTVTCSLYSHGQECARGEVVAVRVPPEWRDPPGRGDLS